MTNIYFRLAGLNYQKALVGGVILAVLYYFFLFDDGSKIDQNVATTNQQILTEEARKKEAEKTIAKAEKLKTENKKLLEYYQMLSRQVPSDLSMADVLRSIDTMAVASGISIKSKEPKSPVKKEIFEEFPISVKGEGSFGELALFLFNMVNTERLTRITSVTLNKAGTKENRGRLSMDVSFTSYRYLVAEKAAAPADGGKK